MAALGNLTINDGVSAATFGPEARDPSQGTVSWVARDANPPLTWRRLMTRMSTPSVLRSAGQAASRVYKVMVNLELPAMETLGTADNGYQPPPTVAYVTRAKLEFFLPERADSSDRAKVLAALISALGQSQVAEQITILSQPLS